MAPGLFSLPPRAQLAKQHIIWAKQQLKSPQIAGIDGNRGEVELSPNGQPKHFIVRTMSVSRGSEPRPVPNSYALRIDSITDDGFLELKQDLVQEKGYLNRIVLHWKVEPPKTLTCTIHRWQLQSPHGMVELKDHEIGIFPGGGDSTIKIPRNHFRTDAAKHEPDIELNVGPLRDYLREYALHEAGGLIPAGNPGPPTNPAVEEHIIPTSQTDIETAANNLVQILGLDQLYNDKQLEEFSMLAAKNIANTLKDLQLPQSSTVDLIKVSLFKTIILCDDSGSMYRGTRWDALKETVERLLPIATRLNETGISLRFINSDPGEQRCSNLGALEAKRIMQQVYPSGGTNIGQVLNSKILRPLLRSMAENTGTYGPVLISIITDGEADDKAEFKRAITNCKTFLESQHGPRATRFGHAAIILQIHYVGTDSGARRFIQEIQRDIGPYIFCNVEPLDQSILKPGVPAGERNRKLLEVTALAVDHVMKHLNETRRL